MNAIIIIFSLILYAGLSEAVSQSKEARLQVKLERKAERKSRNKYLQTGFGAGYLKVIDQGTSPLLYKGLILPYASVGYLVHSNNLIRTFESEMGYGALKTRTATPWYDPANNSFLISLRWNTLFNISHNEDSKIKVYIGPEIHFQGHFRINFKYGNSAFNFDSFLGTGIAARVEYPYYSPAGEFRFLGMNLKHRERNLRFSWQLSSPVYSILVRPSYVTISHFTVPELRSRLTSEHVTSGYFTHVNIRSQAELYYFLHNQNALKACYTWNFYHHDPGKNKVQSAFHALSFSFIFKFNYSDKPSSI